MIKGDPIVRKIDENIQMVFNEHKRIVLCSTIARKIQKTWRGYMERIAPNGEPGWIAE